MDEKFIKILAKGIAKQPLAQRIEAIEKILSDLGKFYEKKELVQKYVV